MADQQYRHSLGDTLHVLGLPPRGTQTHLAVQPWTPRSVQTGRLTCPPVAPESAGEHSTLSPSAATRTERRRHRCGPRPGRGRCRHLPFSQNSPGSVSASWRRRSHCHSSEGKNTFTQRKPLWIHLRTFCSAINTYRQAPRCEQNPRQSHM